MWSIWRTPLSAVHRDAAVVASATGVVGTTFGAIATAEGLPWWATTALSLFVFAGSAQFLLVALLGSGAGLVTALGAALLLNLRLLPLGFVAADLLPRNPLRRFLAVHVVTDETVAFGQGRHGAAGFRTLGTALYVAWNVGTVAGLLLVRLVPDTAALGLDAAFPAALLALVVPALRDPVVRRTAGAGAVLALLAVPFTPSGLPVLLSLLALAPAVLARRPRVVPC